MYAEIGFKSTSQHHKSSKSIQAIDLDDSPVAYVQIQHRIGQESSYPTETQGEMEKNGNTLMHQSYEYIVHAPLFTQSPHNQYI